MVQKLFAALLLTGCVILGVVAWGYHAPFSYEPVGPRAWPLALLLLLTLGAIGLLATVADSKVQQAEHPPSRALLVRLAGCVVLLLIYAALFETLGFIPSAMLLGVGLARLYGGRWSLAIASGLILGIGLYLLFDKALDVPLPLGVLSDWEI